MCQFLSAIVSKNGEIYCDPFIDSHEELIQKFGIRDDQSQFINNIVRVEFIPKDNDYFDIENYTLMIDEDAEPDWWAELKLSVYKNLKERVKRMLVDKAHDKILCGGVYFVRDSNILWTRHSRILVVKNSTIHTIEDGTTIQSVEGNTTINYVRNNAMIRYVKNNTTIVFVKDSATIQYVGGNAKINYVEGNAMIQHVGDDATIQHVGDDATIQHVGENATIKEQSKKTKSNLKKRKRK